MLQRRLKQPGLVVIREGVDKQTRLKTDPCHLPRQIATFDAVVGPIISLPVTENL